jgi:hypothetical protein
MRMLVVPEGALYAGQDWVMQPHKANARSAGQTMLVSHNTKLPVRPEVGAPVRTQTGAERVTRRTGNDADPPGAAGAAAQHLHTVPPSSPVCLHRD